MILRLTTILAAGMALLALAAPASAGAAEFGGQVERSAPARFPENIPGCRPRCVRGDVIHRGRVLLSRTVKLAPGERRASTRFRCPSRHRFLTFGFLEIGDVVLQIPRDQVPYTRRRTIRVQAQRNLAPISRPSTGTLYGLCGRR